MGRTTVQAPRPSAEERRLQAEQLKILQEQRADTAAMKPLLLQSMGFTEDGKGGYRQMTQDELMSSMNPLQRQNYNLQQAYAARAREALEGKIPVDPALENDLKLQEQALYENMSQRLGSNWQQTTAGQQALDAFQRRTEALRTEARTGVINTSQGLLASQAGLLSGQNQNQYANIQREGAGNMGLFNAYGEARQPYQYYAGLRNQADMQNAANQAGLWSAGMGMLGQIGGLAGGMGLGRWMMK